MATATKKTTRKTAAGKSKAAPVRPAADKAKAARKAAPKKAAPKKAAPKKATKAAKGHKCWCGCGGVTKGKSHFLQGHDAKLHSLINKLTADGKKLPKFVPQEAHAYILDRWPNAKSIM